jgi:hypothetical protein
MPYTIIQIPTIRLNKPNTSARAIAPMPGRAHTGPAVRLLNPHGLQAGRDERVHREHDDQPHRRAMRA